MEPMQPIQKPFEGLSLPRKDVARESVRYRVYKNVGEFTMVEAATAMLAFENSGMAKAYKIVKDNPLSSFILRSAPKSD